MTANIIHNKDRGERLVVLLRELESQNITDYKLWPALFNVPRCKGISRAHKQIVQWAKNNEQKEVLVMEDDIKFEAPGAFQYFLDNKPGSFDLYIGGIYRGEIINKRVKQFTGFHLYIVAAKFYDTFLNVDENRDIDHALTKKGDYHVCYPFAAVQWIGWSDNIGKFSDHEPLLKGRKIFGRN